MLKDFKLVSKDRDKKERYADLKIEIRYFEESFIRTSYGDDGNNDGGWGDENAKPVGTF